MTHTQLTWVDWAIVGAYFALSLGIGALFTRRGGESLRDHGVPLNATLRRTQFAARGKRKIPIHGCFQCYQAITTSNGQPSQNAPYGEVIAGSSMVLTTELTKRGPRSEGILTYSQATDPTSRWFANQTGLFSRKRWVPMRFTAAQLARDRGARRTKLP